MKVQFRRDKRGEILMSDTFNWDYNPYRVGDMIEMTTIENAFNELYDIVISGNYKLK